MRFTKIQGVLVNLEKVAEITTMDSFMFFEVSYDNGKTRKFTFDSSELRDAEFDRLEKLIYEIQ